MKKKIGGFIAALAAMIGMGGPEVVEEQAPWIARFRTALDAKWSASDTARSYAVAKEVRSERQKAARAEEARLRKANASTPGALMPAARPSKPPQYVAPHGVAKPKATTRTKPKRPF